MVDLGARAFPVFFLGCFYLYLLERVGFPIYFPTGLHHFRPELPRRTNSLPSSFLVLLTSALREGVPLFHGQGEGRYDAVFGFFSGGNVNFRDQEESWRRV